MARVARSLHALPLCALPLPDVADAAEQQEQYRVLADVLAARMMGWHARFSGKSAWAHFLNKSSFLHEVEETLFPLRLLRTLPSGVSGEPPYVYKVPPRTLHCCTDAKLFGFWGAGR